MASAFKCDRCGSFYTYEDKTNIYNELGYELKVTKAYHYLGTGNLDLCYSCTGDLNNFLNEKTTDN